jgi:hypothetical protein
MIRRPRSKFADENGLININAPSTEDEYPEVVAWDKAYQAECDQLSEIRAAKYNRYWGRWYLNDEYLCTDIVRAPEGSFRGGCNEVYDIALSRCVSEKSRQRWILHMDEKRWIGDQGLKDLARAFGDLIKANII